MASPRHHLRPIPSAPQAASVLLYAALASVACSGDHTGGGFGDVILPDASSLEGGAGADTGPDLSRVATIDTLASPTTALAGQPVDVLCVALDEAGQPIAGVPMDFAVLESTGLYHRDITTNPPQVVFEGVGKHVLRCALEGGTIIDHSPLDLEVIAGEPAVIETTLDKHTIVAGDKIELSCEAWDAYGNKNDWVQLVPALSPGDGWVASALVVKIAKAGIFQVACQAPINGAMDSTPEVVKVEPGLPRRVVAQITPNTIEAGQKAQLQCVATDAWGNAIAGFPMAVNKPAAVSLQGKSITSLVAGLYQVRCVPESDPWDWYEIVPGNLQVVPGPPAEIYVDLLPPKPVYQKNDTVTMAVSVLDVFGNLVSDAELKPVVIQPPEGVVVLEPTTFRFADEGIFNFGWVVEDHPEVSTTVQIVVDGTGPLIVIEQPPRGATLAGKPAVNVTGFVADNVAGIVTLAINGSLVTVKPDGTFTHLMQAQQGMNLIIAEAVDLGGQVSTTSRSFFYSSKWYDVDPLFPTKARVADGLMFWMGQNFLDDGVHDTGKPDDIASVILKFLENFDLNGAVPSPAASFTLIGSWNYKLYLQGISFNTPKLKLETFDGGLGIDVKLPNFLVNMKLVGKCQILFFDVCPDFSGQVKANPVSLVTQLLAGKDASGKPALSSGATQVSLVGLDVNINGILGQLFDFLIDWIVGLFAKDIEKTFAQQVGSEVVKLMTSLFDALALDETFEVSPLVGSGPPASLALGSALSTLTFAKPGALVGLEAGVITAKKVAQKPLGSIARASCLSPTPEPPYQPPADEFGIALHDDFLNQALFSVWLSGSLNVVLGPDDLSGLGDLSSMLEMGVSDLALETVFFAAPMLTSCNPAQQMKVQIGDLFLLLNANVFGLPLTVGMFVSLEIDAKVEMVSNFTTGAKEVGLTLQKVTRVELDVVSINEEWASLKGWLTDLVNDQLIGGLVDSLQNESLPGIPIPEIDLSSLDPSFPPNTVLNIQLTTLRRWGGYTALDGYVE